MENTSCWLVMQPVSPLNVKRSFCSGGRHRRTALTAAGVILGCYINISEWIQAWHQEVFHHSINNVTPVSSETEKQLCEARTQEWPPLCVLHGHKRRSDTRPSPGMTHRLTDTLYSIPWISLQQLNYCDHTWLRDHTVPQYNFQVCVGSYGLSVLTITTDVLPTLIRVFSKIRLWRESSRNRKPKWPLTENKPKAINVIKPNNGWETADIQEQTTEITRCSN